MEERAKGPGLDLSVVLHPYRLELIACTLGALGLTAAAVWTAYARLADVDVWPQRVVAAAVAAVALPYLSSWWRAVYDRRLPVLPLGAPKHRHFTGWGAIALILAIGGIVLLAAWASASDRHSREIQSAWGVATVAVVAGFFILAAALPSMPEPGPKAAALARFLSAIVSPVGRLLSVVDSMLVFALAGSVGAAQTHALTRYLILVGVLVPCAILGFALPAPWGLYPVAWGLLVAISLSRRWAWVEDDRELAMLNRRYSGDHLRIGFSQDLRDEALVAFMSMFLLVPLALRQLHLWYGQSHIELFTVSGANVWGVYDWIAFYGSELAKAVPFVDWADVYKIEGAARLKAESGDARNYVFATRVLVDLVLLAALLQALAISARTAKQKELFFEHRSIDRLDPFIEPREFRKLALRQEVGGLVADAEKLARFPRYDAIRLAELATTAKDPEVAFVARELRIRDGVGNSADFHDELLRLAMKERPDKDAIGGVIVAIRAAGPERQAYEIDEARKALNRKPPMNEVRRELMRLIVEAPDSDERTSALISALTEPDRDTRYEVRSMALQGLAAPVRRGDERARATLLSAQQSDPAAWIRSEAEKLLRGLGGT